MDVSKLKPHPVNLEIYGDTEVDGAFLESVKTHGILEPLIAKPDGTIISGHRRWKAAVALCLDEVPCRVVEYTSELAEQEAIIEYNRQRVKTFEQKMKEAEKLKKIEEERAKERQAATQLAGKDSEGQPVQKSSVRENFPAPKEPPGRARDAIAAAAGFGSGRQYEKADKVWQAAKTGDGEATKLVQALNEGRTTIHAAYRKINLKGPVEPPPLPEGKYQVIYCDPPWEYSNSGFETSAQQKYPVMSIEELEQLNVKDLAAENSALFMWATNPQLEYALRLMNSWGFKYKTNLVWVKDRHTAGFYVFGKHELLLIGVRGSMLPEEKFVSVITDSNKKHSKKPEKVYETIEKMYPGKKYVELFARNLHPGWCSWGNEV